MNRPNPKVDGYIRKNKRWRDELEKLRAVVLDCPLTEDVKWRTPCYTFEGGNVVMIGTMKACCTLSFMKGALLKDTHGILEKPGENTRAARMMRFTSVQEIVAVESILKAYIHEAIEVEKAGLKVDFKKDAEPAIPEELRRELDKTPAFKAAFDALTPGRRRWYLLYFAAAKQSKTRAARVKKWMPHILDGKGMHD